jgi:hypothetical protein
MKLKLILYSMTTLFLFWANAGSAVQLLLEAPNSGQWISNSQISGQLSLGVLSLMGDFQSASTQVDAVYPVNASGLILAPDHPGLSDAMLYIMGVSPSQAALQVRLTDAEDTQAEVFVSYVGDLSFYTSLSSAQWQPGTLLNGVEHIEIPSDNTLIGLNGPAGRLSPDFLDAENPLLALDLVCKLSRQELAGPKSGTLSFTVIAQ